MTAQNVSVGDGSLASVVAGINGADAGVTATALQVGTNQYALEVTSNSTGTAGAATVDTQAFSSSSLGALQTTTAAQNAIVSIGGTGGFQVTSPTNTVTGLAPRRQREPGPGECDAGDHHGRTGRLPSGEPGVGPRQRGQPGALQHLDRYGLQPVDQHRRPAQRPDVA